MTFGLDRRPKNLAEIITGTIADTAKMAIIGYPLFVGIMTHLKDTKFFEQAYNSLPVIAGVATANVAMQVVNYARANYHLKKRSLRAD